MRVILTRIARTSLVVGAGIVALLPGCHARRTPCPAGYAPDASRSERISAHLISAGEPSPPADALQCFGPASESSVTSSGAMLLNAAADDRDLAARVAHLLLHSRQGDPLDLRPGPATCAQRMERARQTELRARDQEDRIRSRLGRPPVEPSELDRVLSEYARRCRQAGL